MTTRRILALSIVALAVPVFASLSEKYSQFAKGPEQFLMTREEQAQWKKLKTDEQGEAFIQLFWARRDPTPETPRNEFRNEFAARVAYADQVYRTKRTRGSLTDMGRVYLLLGPPQESRSVAKGQEQSNVEGSFLSGGAFARIGGKRSFTYPNAIHLNLTGPVMFIENSFGEYKIDFQQGGVAGALATAQRKAIVNPDLTEAPSWAPVEAPESELGREIVTHKFVDVEMVPKVVVPESAIGVKSLTLLKDVFSLQPHSGKNPFDGVDGTSTFTRSDELGWAAQYCGNSDMVRVSMLLSVKVKGKDVTMSAPAEEMAPEAIKALPGCYLVRAAVPLEEMESGDYELTVRIEDPVTQQGYDLQQAFRLE